MPIADMLVDEPKRYYGARTRKIETLLPLYKPTTFDKIERAMRDYLVRVGMYKTFAAAFLMFVALQMTGMIIITREALANQTITPGEYCSILLTIDLILIFVIVYEFYFVDLVLGDCFKKVS